MRFLIYADWLRYIVYWLASMKGEEKGTPYLGLLLLSILYWLRGMQLVICCRFWGSHLTQMNYFTLSNMKVNLWSVFCFEDYTLPMNTSHCLMYKGNGLSPHSLIVELKVRAFINPQHHHSSYWQLGRRLSCKRRCIIIIYLIDMFGVSDVESLSWVFLVNGAVR